MFNKWRSDLKKKKHYDKIKIKGQKNFNSFKNEVPSDPSSCAFFELLKFLSKNCKLKIQNVNLNQSRIGYIELLKKREVKIKKKIYLVIQPPPRTLYPNLFFK